jgi:hypothetical protein
MTCKLGLKYIIVSNGQLAQKQHNQAIDILVDRV